MKIKITKHKIEYIFIITTNIYILQLSYNIQNVHHYCIHSMYNLHYIPNTYYCKRAYANI